MKCYNWKVFVFAWFNPIVENFRSDITTLNSHHGFAAYQYNQLQENLLREHVPPDTCYGIHELDKLSLFGQLISSYQNVAMKYCTNTVGNF